MERTITFIAEDKKRERMIAKEDVTDQEGASSQQLQEKKEHGSENTSTK
ncbi:MAG: hypothetical protein WD426_17730 [Anditalea sp.]